MGPVQRTNEAVSEGSGDREPPAAAIDESGSEDAEQAKPAPVEHAVPTRVSASWTAVVIAVVVLILLVIFIAENTQRSTVNFLGVHGHAPTVVAPLIAAVAGGGFVAVVAIARILQLRHRVSKNARRIS